MPVIFPNAVLSTARATYNAATGQTSAPAAYLSALPANIAPVKASQLASLPQNALASQYVAKVESGTDCVMGDTITDIRQSDGLTPWPVPFPAGVTCWVRHAQESAPGILAERHLYLEFVQSAGPAY